MTSAANLTTKGYQHVGFVTASPVRGTIELAWGCLFTIILCTWNIQRLVVPSPKDSTWTKLTRKVGWMLFTVAIPEWLTFYALLETYNAWSTKREMHRKGFRSW